MKHLLLSMNFCVSSEMLSCSMDVGSRGILPPFESRNLYDYIK